VAIPLLIAALQRVRKSFAGVEALQGVSLGIEAGELFAVLGPNGAGKTTLLAILQGALQPDTGNATLFGVDATRLSLRERSWLGGQLDRGGLSPNLTAREVLRLASSLYARGEAPDSMLERVGLGRAACRLVRDLSIGEHRRLAVAVALIGRPRLCFLDEPTLALDPDGQRCIWDLIQGSNAAGTTFVLATHAVREAEALCHRVVFLREGKVVNQGTPSALVARANPLHRIRIDGAYPATLKDCPEVSSIRSSAGHTVIFSQNPAATLSALFASDPHLLHRVRWCPARLEDALFDARDSEA